MRVNVVFEKSLLEDMLEIEKKLHFDQGDTNYVGLRPF